MLVLNRKKHEGIVINNDISITVLEIRDGRVRLGITAPREIPVHRHEVWLGIQEGTYNASGEKIAKARA